MSVPNFPAMIKTQVEVNEQLGHAMALLCPDPVSGADASDISDQGYAFAAARIQRARSLLDDFMAAARGEVR